MAVGIAFGGAGATNGGLQFGPEAFDPQAFDPEAFDDFLLAELEAGLDALCAGQLSALGEQGEPGRTGEPSEPGGADDPDEPDEPGGAPPRPARRRYRRLKATWAAREGEAPEDFVVRLGVERALETVRHGYNSTESRRAEARYRRERMRLDEAARRRVRARVAELAAGSDERRARQERVRDEREKSRRAARRARRVPPSEQRTHAGPRFGVHAALVAAARAGRLDAARLAALDELYARPTEGLTADDAAAEWDEARGRPRRPPRGDLSRWALVGEMRLLELEAGYAAWGRPPRGPLASWARNPGPQWAGRVRELLGRLDPGRLA